MSDRCDRCGALLALVGFVHRCIPKPSLQKTQTSEPKCLMAPATKNEPKNTAHPDKPVKTKNPIKPNAKAKPKRK